MQQFVMIVAAMALAGTPALAQDIVDRTFAGGLVSPVFLTHAPGDTDRVFVVQRGPFIGSDRRSGSIVIFNRSTGQRSGQPFLTVTTSGNSERGLLGLAFHPEYADNGVFFVSYTNLDGDSVIERYTVSSDPDIADADSGEVVLTIDQPASNHNGGWLGFAPGEPYLYVSVGDGGGGGDPFETGQDLTTLLGKIIRLDIDGDDFPSDPARNYAIPGGNPFLGDPDARDEIWAWGLRNPWRNSFDRETGDFYIADVGQDRREEVNFQPAGSAGGQNYGWDCLEGSLGFESTGCAGLDFTAPLFEYSHGSNGCSITGGYVYRGCAIPELRGAYIFGDFCSGRIWSLRVQNGAFTDFRNLTESVGIPGFTLASFGEDAFGELYTVDIGGNIRKIVPQDPPADSDGDGIPDTCESPCSQGDLAEPFGTLNAADVNTFVNAFLGGLPEADVAAPFGTLNAADVNTFVNAFLEGCP